MGIHPLTLGYLLASAAKGRVNPIETKWSEGGDRKEPKENLRGLFLEEEGQRQHGQNQQRARGEGLYVGDAQLVQPPPTAGTRTEDSYGAPISEAESGQARQRERQ